MSTSHVNQLPNGTKLDQYQIVDLLGYGGFGLTYKAWDENLERWVAIKEFLPSMLAYRPEGELSIVSKTASAEEHVDLDYGVDKFLDEARTLAKFNHPNIVRVNRYFEANNTAYMVMEYEEGITLKEHLKRFGTLDQSQLLDITLPILSGLEAIHNKGILHRDIKPGNIYLRNGVDDTGKPKGPMLIDFGAARYAVGQQSQDLTSIVSQGYAPPEAYVTDGKRQGSWSDIYSLGSTLYQCITGVKAQDSLLRKDELEHDSTDPLPSLKSLKPKDYDEHIIQVIDHMLALSLVERPKDAAMVMKLLAPQQSSATSELNTPASKPRGSEDATMISPKPSPSSATRTESYQAAAPRKSRWPIFAALAVLLVGSLGAGVWYWQTQQFSGLEIITTETPLLNEPAESETPEQPMQLIEVGGVQEFKGLSQEQPLLDEEKQEH